MVTGLLIGSANAETLTMTTGDAVALSRALGMATAPYSQGGTAEKPNPKVYPDMSVDTVNKISRDIEALKSVVQAAQRAHAAAVVKTESDPALAGAEKTELRKATLAVADMDILAQPVDVELVPVTVQELHLDKNVNINAEVLAALSKLVQDYPPPRAAK